MAPLIAVGVDATGAGDDGTITAIDAALQSLARQLRQGRVHEYFARQAGVGIDQGGLAVLYVLAEQDASLRVTDLAARLGVDAPGVTRKTQQLERLGLISRCRDATDARACPLRLTPEGHRVLRKFLHARHQWLTDVLASWPPAERREFARLITRLTGEIQSPAPAGPVAEGVRPLGR